MDSCKQDAPQAQKGRPSRRRQDILRALQESSHDIAANVELPLLLQRLTERVVSALPAADRALLMVQEGEKLVVRGAAGYAPLNPIGQAVPITAVGSYLRGTPALLTPLPEPLRWALSPEAEAQLQALPPGRATLLYRRQIQDGSCVLLTVTNAQNAKSFDKIDRQIADLLAHQAASAVERARLFIDIQERLQTESALHRIGQEIASHLRIPELVPAIHHHIAQVMDAPSFLIAVKRPHGNDLLLLSPIDGGQVVPDQEVSSHGVLGWVVRNRRTLRFGDMQREVTGYPDIRIQPLGEDTFIPGALLAVPLLIGDQVIGALSVQSPQPNVYDEGDEHLLTTLANHIAVAVQNARLYQEVQQKRAELQGLIAAVAQRLQDPVEALSGFGRLLRESALNLSPEQEDYLRRLERNSHWIAQLNQDMLFLARLDQIQEEVEPIALSTLVQGVATHLELEQQGIEVAIPPDMPTLYADPVLLWAYFRNLLQNARQMLQETAAPRIEVRCALSSEGYLLSVRVNGRTLTPEEVQHAYELFFPIGGPESAGIGLAIAQRIAEHYGGRVWAAAAAGGGTILNLMLPPELGINREDRR